MPIPTHTHTPSVRRWPLVLGLAALLGGAARADHHEASMLEGKIMQFYAAMNGGDFEQAFAHVAVGGSGFLPYGLKYSIPNEAVMAMVIADAAEARAQGETAKLFPKHMDIRMLGSDAAVASYYVEGEMAEDGDSQHVINRATLVLERQDDDSWKIVHWHVSKLERADHDD